MTDNCCDKTALKDEVKNLTEKLKTHKQKYQKLSIENLQKDLIIRQLKSKVEKTKFSSFENVLSKSCIKKLNSISDSKKEDSQFVTVVLSSLYNDDNETIKKLCLKRAKNLIEISQEKKQILEDIYTERLKNKIEDIKERKKKLNKLIRNAIDNSKRK